MREEVTEVAACVHRIAEFASDVRGSSCRFVVANDLLDREVATDRVVQQRRGARTGQEPNVGSVDRPLPGLSTTAV